MITPQKKPAPQTDIRTTYEKVRPDYVRLTKKVEGLLIDLMAARGLTYHLIESRTKDLNSVLDKVSRSSKSYSDPMRELTDLSGIRIIAYYEDDAELIGEIIEQEFNIDRQNSLPRESAPSEFGYKSAHYIVSLNDARAGLPEYSALNGLRAEIQVRTVLQHAWAAISHKLQYKREDDVPAPLRRKLFRLSALFELADDEFISLRERSSSFQKDISSRIDAGNLNIPLDGQSLRTYLDTSPTVSGICVGAEEAGFDFRSPNRAGGEDDDEVQDRDNPSDLIQLATIAGLPTLAALDAELLSAQEWSKRYLREQYRASRDTTQGEWYVTPGFVCQLVLIKSRKSQLQLKTLVDLGWDRVIAKRVIEMARSFDTDLGLGHDS